MNRASVSLQHLAALGTSRVLQAVARHPILFAKALLGLDTSKIPPRLLRRYVPNGGILIEAGGFDGSDTWRLLRWLNPKKLIVVEAHPHLSRRLEMAFAHEPRVLVIDGALGQEDGAVMSLKTFATSSDPHGSSSLLEPALIGELHPDVSFDESIDVTVRSLESILDRHAIGVVDLLWLDVQGFELAVLRGLGDRVTSVNSLHLEVSVVGNYQGAPTEPEIHRWLIEAGFRRVSRRVLVSNGNCLYVRR